MLLAREPGRNWLIDDAWKLKNGEKFPAHLSGCSELVNDIHSDLINFWRVLRCPELFKSFHSACQATQVSREDWVASGRLLAENLANGPVERAWAFFTFCRQSHAGQMKGFTSPTRTRTRGRINGNVNEWLSAVEGLPTIHGRLKSVFIENMDALKLIVREDTENTFYYADPPYLSETRVSKDMYRHEMSSEKHEELLCILAKIKGKFMLSGYPSEMYKSHQARFGWRCQEFDISNHASGAKEKGRETECVWMNF